jgi:cation diffusion facilitator CzcD-associated flavoprotein CzcO
MAERRARIVILGAGPAGIAAAAALVEQGHRPMVIDEAQAPGGRAYRRPSATVTLDAKRFLGSQAAKFTKLHASFAGLHDRIETIGPARSPGMCSTVPSIPCAARSPKRMD